MAVVDFVSDDHYVTYTHRSCDDAWELYNDLTQRISLVKINKVVLHLTFLSIYKYRKNIFLLSTIGMYVRVYKVGIYLNEITQIVYIHFKQRI